MKAQMEEVEDDLAAEEENKLINEVGSGVLVLEPVTDHFSTFLGIQNLVRLKLSLLDLT